MSIETMTLYEAECLFDLPSSYTQSDVKSAYRKLILEKHPDVRKDVDAATANHEASKINTAKKLLLNRFKDNPQASFTRLQTEKSSSRTTSFTTSSSSQTRKTSSYTDSSETTVNWYDQWWQVASPDTDTAPVEETTWEDLANEFWAEYSNATADARISEKRMYSLEDLKRDTVSSVIGGATKGAARFMDGTFGSETQQEMSKEVAAYEKKKRTIDWATGRLAVLGYFLFVALFVFLGIIAFSVSKDAAAFGYAMILASIVYGIAIINIFVPFITVLLRKIPYKILDKEYAALQDKNVKK